MVRRQQMADRALHPAMRSPGRPIPARHVERELWRLIAQGKPTEEAAAGVGVSSPSRLAGFVTMGG
jgi:DNA-binding CsgD family transcriptional regulator